jgi:hypothetical protein
VHLHVCHVPQNASHMKEEYQQTAHCLAHGRIAKGHCIEDDVAWTIERYYAERCQSACQVGEANIKGMLPHVKNCYVFDPEDIILTNARHFIQSFTLQRPLHTECYIIHKPNELSISVLFANSAVFKETCVGK